MSNHLFVVLLLWLSIALIVAVHASGRDRSAVVWFLVTFFTGLIGVVIYLLVLLSAAGRSDDPEVVRICPECSASHEGFPAYCSDCGEPLEADDDASTATILRSGSRGYCSDCKSRVDLDAAACPNCDSAF